MGQYYSTRHTLGQYRSACVTASFTFHNPNGPSSLQGILPALEVSLQATIRQHPGLCYGISDELREEIPLFTHLRTIDLRDVLEVLPSQRYNVPDTTMSEVLGRFHANLWCPDKPAWKVIVIEHLIDGPSTGLGTLSRLDIAFFAHHAIADGLSCIAFHSSLMDNLQLSLELVLPARWPLRLDETLSIPPTVEECMDIAPCRCITCNGQSNLTQPVWAGGDISTTPQTNFESRVRIITFLPEAVCRILRKCKLARVTLTGLLHAYICTSLQRALKKEGINEDTTLGFRSVTPFQIRKHTGVSDKDILNHISYLTTYIPHDELDKTVACDANSDSEEKHIVELARFFSDDIVTKVKQFPHGNNMAGQLGQIRDTFQYCKSQGGQKRQYTYELSNLGSIPNMSLPERSGIKIEKLVFTQCGFIAGPALGFNCVSVKGGPLTLSVTWQGGIVQESIIESVIDELETRIGCQGGCIRGDSRTG
ncbi:hypothetical protein FVEN_g9493 [Fusarium venenatum]|nr:hypothetical protein FVEN_g9493 [Fusarium venenatum]